MRVLDADDVQDVKALAFSPNGRYLAIGAHGLGLLVHDLGGGAAPVRLGPDGFRWQAIAEFDPAGAVVGLTTAGRTRFDPTTGARLGDGPFDPAGPRPVGAFAASADGTRLVTLQAWRPQSRLACWDAAGNGWAQRWLIDGCPICSSPAVSADGSRVAYFGTIEHRPGLAFELVLLDAETGERVGTGKCPGTPEFDPAFRPDGRQIVTPHNTQLRVWDTRVPGKPVVVRNDSRRHFTAAAYHPSGRYLFTTSNDATVTVWDTEDWVRVKRFDWSIGRLRAVAVSPDGLLAAAGSDRGQVVVWDVDL